MSKPEYDLATQDYLRNLAKQLADAKFGESAGILKLAASRLGVHQRTVYRLIEEFNQGNRKSRRSDYGKSKVTMETVQMIGAMTYASARSTGKRTLTIRTANEVLQNQYDPITGEIHGTDASLTTILRVMKQHHVHPSQIAIPSPHVQMRSEHPNHVWQIDASVCVLFYLPETGLQPMDGRKYYHNKPQNLTKIQQYRVIRYVVADHYSHAFYVHYCIGSESSENLMNAFIAAIQPRRASDPMHGVPKILMMDAGAANNSAIFQNLLKRLSVQPLIHMPGAARVNGSVERAHEIIEREFEGRLSFATPQNLNELQAKCDDWRDQYQATRIHRRHKKTRHAAWLEILESQLRVPPNADTCFAISHTKPIKVTVNNDLTISFSPLKLGAHRYNVRHIENVTPKAKLLVCVNPYAAPAINIIITEDNGAERFVNVEPMNSHAGGYYENAPIIGKEYNAPPKSDAERAKETIRELAWSEKTEFGVAKAKSKKQDAFNGTIDPWAKLHESHREYMNRKGVKLAPNIPILETTNLNLVVAAERIIETVGHLWGEADYRALAENYPEGVPESEIKTIADAIIQRNTFTKSKLHLVKSA